MKLKADPRTGVAPEIHVKVDSLRDSLRSAAKDYIREWSARYKKHEDLARLDWDGSQVEYHLANFAARTLLSGEEEIAQPQHERLPKLLELASEQAHNHKPVEAFSSYCLKCIADRMLANSAAPQEKKNGH